MHNSGTVHWLIYKQLRVPLNKYLICFYTETIPNSMMTLAENLLIREFIKH